MIGMQDLLCLPNLIMNSPFLALVILLAYTHRERETIALRRLKTYPHHSIDIKYEG